MHGFLGRFGQCLGIMSALVAGPFAPQWPSYGPACASPREIVYLVTAPNLEHSVPRSFPKLLEASLALPTSRTMDGLHLIWRKP